jgi:hypothetical protein
MSSVEFIVGQLLLRLAKRVEEEEEKKMEGGKSKRV